MLPALVTMAAEAAGEASSQTAFYVLGGILAAFAVAVSLLGLARRDSFPPGEGAARAVMGLAAVLVVLTCASAVLSA